MYSQILPVQSDLINKLEKRLLPVLVLLLNDVAGDGRATIRERLSP
jgi:hypothetical protein